MAWLPLQRQYLLLFWCRWLAPLVWSLRPPEIHDLLRSLRLSRNDQSHINIIDRFPSERVVSLAKFRWLAIPCAYLYIASKVFVRLTVNAWTQLKGHEKYIVGSTP